MIALLFLFYFAIGLQLLFKEYHFIKTQFVFGVCLTLLNFNFHSHLTSLVKVL